MSLPHPLWCVITGLREGCNATGFRVVRTHPPGTRGSNQDLLLVCAGNRLERTAVTPKNHKATICCPHADYEGRHRAFRCEKWTYGNQLDWHSVPTPASARPPVPIAVGPKRRPANPGSGSSLTAHPSEDLSRRPQSRPGQVGAALSRLQPCVMRNADRPPGCLTREGTAGCPLADHLGRRGRVAPHTTARCRLDPHAA